MRGCILLLASWLVWPMIGLGADSANAVTESATGGKLEEVPPADLARLKPSDFTDDEVDLPYYLAHFHRLANSMVTEGENRGFLRLPVWRGDVEPFNARVMENHLALAFFYATR